MKDRPKRDYVHQCSVQYHALTDGARSSVVIDRYSTCNGGTSDPLGILHHVSLAMRIVSVSGGTCYGLDFIL